MSSPLIIRMQKADVGYVVELCGKILPKNSILSNQGAPKSLQTFDSLIGICQLDFELTAMVLMNKKVVLIMEFFFSKTEGCPYWPGLTDLTLINWILLLIGSRESKKRGNILSEIPWRVSKKNPLTECWQTRGVLSSNWAPLEALRNGSWIFHEKKN